MWTNMNYSTSLRPLAPPATKQADGAAVPPPPPTIREAEELSTGKSSGDAMKSSSAVVEGESVTVSSSICAGAECKEIGVSRCSACKVVLYCSRACQKNDWKRHKASCKQLAAAASKAAVSAPPAVEMKAGVSDEEHTAQLLSSLCAEAEKEVGDGRLTSSRYMGYPHDTPSRYLHYVASGQVIYGPCFCV